MSFRITEILKPECVKVPLAATEKHAAIDELADYMAEVGVIQDSSALKAAVWERETIRTTGIGQGIAIPHGKFDGCGELKMAIGKPVEPIEFQAIDNQPVAIIFMLASPLDQTGPHVQALSKICTMLLEDELREAMLASGDPVEVYQMIADFEAKSVG